MRWSCELFITTATLCTWGIDCGTTAEVATSGRWFGHDFSATATLCIIIINCVTIATIQILAVLTLYLTAATHLCVVIIQFITAAIICISADGNDLAIAASLFVVIVHTAISAARCPGTCSLGVQCAVTAYLTIVVICSWATATGGRSGFRHNLSIATDVLSIVISCAWTTSCVWRFLFNDISVAAGMCVVVVLLVVATRFFRCFSTDLTTAAELSLVNVRFAHTASLSTGAAILCNSLVHTTKLSRIVISFLTTAIRSAVCPFSDVTITADLCAVLIRLPSTAGLRGRSTFLRDLSPTTELGLIVVTLNFNFDFTPINTTVLWLFKTTRCCLNTGNQLITAADIRAIWIGLPTTTVLIITVTIKSINDLSITASFLWIIVRFINTATDGVRITCTVDYPSWATDLVHIVVGFLTAARLVHIVSFHNLLVTTHLPCVVISNITTAYVAITRSPFGDFTVTTNLSQITVSGCTAAILSERFPFHYLIVTAHFFVIIVSGISTAVCVRLFGTLSDDVTATYLFSDVIQLIATTALELLCFHDSSIATLFFVVIKTLIPTYTIVSEIDIYNQ